MYERATVINIPGEVLSGDRIDSDVLQRIIMYTEVNDPMVGSTNSVKKIRIKDRNYYLKHYGDIENARSDATAYFCINRFSEAMGRAREGDFLGLCDLFDRKFTRLAWDKKRLYRSLSRHLGSGGKFHNLDRGDREYLISMMPQLRSPDIVFYDENKWTSVFESVDNVSLFDVLPEIGVMKNVREGALEMTAQRLSFTHEFLGYMSRSSATTQVDYHKNIERFYRYFKIDMTGSIKKEIQKLDIIINDSQFVCKRDYAPNHLIMMDDRVFKDIVDLENRCSEDKEGLKRGLDSFFGEIDFDKCHLGISMEEEFAQAFCYSLIGLSDTEVKKYFMIYHLWEKTYSDAFRWIETGQSTKRDIEKRKERIQQITDSKDIDAEFDKYFLDPNVAYQRLCIGIASRALRSSVNRISRNLGYILQQMHEILSHTNADEWNILDDAAADKIRTYSANSLQQSTMSINEFVYGSKGYLAQAETHLRRAGFTEMAGTVEKVRNLQLFYAWAVNPNFYR